MDPQSILGVGLTILGVSAPVTVAILKLVRSCSNSKQALAPVLGEYDARLRNIETQTAVQYQMIKQIAQTVERIEAKLEL